MKRFNWGTRNDLIELMVIVFIGSALLMLAGCSTEEIAFNPHVPLVHYNKFHEPVNPVVESFHSLDEVNTFVNKVRYVPDPKDIWQTPAQFYANGGDCEDYALAKYALIKANHLGTPKLFMVSDHERFGAIHMLVLVGDKVLDNQNTKIVSYFESTIRYSYLAEVQTNG